MANVERIFRNSAGGHILPADELKTMIAETEGLKIIDSVNGEPPFLLTGPEEAFESLQQKMGALFEQIKPQPAPGKPGIVEYPLPRTGPGLILP